MNFLLEIGAEEIPDWMIPGALEYLSGAVADSTGAKEVSADATPRRLAVRAAGLIARQPDREEYVTGPSKSAPPQAVQGFARKQGVAVEDLTERDGKYAYLKRTPGRAMKDHLAESLPALILKTPFPKTMYWTAKHGPRFIRPIRWIVALLDDDVVPFEVAGVSSGNESSGHRRLGAARFPVTCENYEEKLRDNFVLLTAARRAAIQLPANVKPDAKLLETLVYLTEYPSLITGDFDPEFLQLPEEVLTTVMRSHQKYFSVEGPDGKLAPHFVAVTNTSADPEGFIQHGNERVLRARFNDARFFWETDQKKTLEARVADLAHVTFQAKLGTYLDKTQRVEGLVAILDGDANALRAARLCKTDLTTELVKEFTELQGVIGGLYARAQGEPEEVAAAIYDHYKPVSMEDTIPRTASGRLLSIADKLDTLIGCFHAGLIPSGSKDPFALRRAAQGIVKIIVEAKLRVELRSYVGKDARLEEFVLDRVRYYFRDLRGFKYDEVNAVLASGWDDLTDVEERLIKIQAVRQTADFEPLAASFKRIQNILKQAGWAEEKSTIDESLLEPGPERALFDAYQQVREKGALQEISTLRPVVDTFFDKVMVNAPDPRVRENRLALLQALLNEFSIADFSEIVTNF